MTSRCVSCVTHSTLRNSVTPRKWTDLNAWTASSVWLKSKLNHESTSTPSFVTKMQSHPYSMAEQYLTAHVDVIPTRDKGLCSNLVTPFNSGVCFAIVFAPPLNK